jgi:hypothetical protein
MCCDGLQLGQPLAAGDYNEDDKQSADETSLLLDVLDYVLDVL